MTVIVPGESDGPLLVTSSDQVNWAPAVAEPVCDLTIARSARVSSVLVSVSVLLPGFGSVVVAVTVAVLTIVPSAPGGTDATTVITGATAPAARSAARVHVTEPEPGTQVQPVPDALTSVVPAGSVSVTRIGPRDTDGPRLRTSSSYVASAPATTAPMLVFAIDRSASALTATVSVPVLLPGTGSVVVPDTTAVLVMLPV